MAEVDCGLKQTKLIFREDSSILMKLTDCTAYKIEEASLFVGSMKNGAETSLKFNIFN